MKFRGNLILFLFSASLLFSNRLKAFDKVLSKESFILSGKIFRQADAVSREMGWVISNVRQAPGSSVFGRLQRAVIKETHGKLQKSPVLKCDSYKIKSLGQEQRPFKFEIYEVCNTKYPLHLATVVLEKNDQIQVDFYPMNLSEEMGLAASVMNKKTHCDLSFQRTILKTMNCQNWAQDRNKTEVVELRTFVYTADKESLLQIKGVILEGMNPKAKIDSQVPLRGRIVVTESELAIPIRGRHKKKMPSAENLPDPEYIQGQDAPGISEVAPVPLQNQEPVGEPSER